MNERLKRSLIFAFSCSLVGLAIGIYISITATGKGYEIFGLYAGVASFIMSFITWYFIIDGQKNRNTLISLLISVAMVAISHHLTFYFATIYQNICFYTFDACRSSLGEPPMNLFVAIYMLSPITVMSLLFFGWITVPVGLILTLGLEAYYFRFDKD